MGVLTVERADATLGARVIGVRLAELDDATWDGVTNHPKGAYGYHDGPAPLRPLVKTHPSYHHDWQVGDLVVWDNRCVLHRARPWNLDQLRVMKHTRVSGDPKTEGVAA